MAATNTNSREHVNARTSMFLSETLNAEVSLLKEQLDI